MSRREYDFEKLRSKWVAKTEKKEDRLPSNYYPFYKMEVDKTARIRFLPDKNENNDDFVVAKVFHNLTINGERKAVPCMTMYGHKTEECPICALSTEYYAKDDKINGKAFWRKYQYIGQVLVIEDPLPPNDKGEKFEGKVKLVSLGNSIHKIIEEAFKSREIDAYPSLYKGGTDFIVKKTRQGENNVYVHSKFARNSTDLDDEVIDYCEAQLIDLSTVLPKNPGVEHLEAMLEAALTGKTVDVSSDSEMNDADEEDVPKTVSKTVSAPTVKESVAVTKQVVEDEAPVATSKPTIDAKSILDKIKNRG